MRQGQLVYGAIRHKGFMTLIHVGVVGKIKPATFDVVGTDTENKMLTVHNVIPPDGKFNVKKVFAAYKGRSTRVLFFTFKSEWPSDTRYRNLDNVIAFDAFINVAYARVHDSKTEALDELVGELIGKDALETLKAGLQNILLQNHTI